MCWALEDTKKTVQGQKAILRTDRESVYQRITRKEINSKKPIDVRISRILAGVGSNFPAPTLSIKFVLEKYNEEADVLSR